MYRISIIAVVAAFLAEFAVDLVTQNLLLMMFAAQDFSPEMGEEALRQLSQKIMESTGFMTASVILGSSTVVGGGYLAARIARRFPYYQGLGIGILGVALTLYLWRSQPLWLGLLSLITNIPLSIWGAHLAKRHLPPPE
jgi:hypothetical protein